MSNGVNKPGLRQQQRSLSDRVGALEQNVARALIGISQRFNGLESRATNLEELVEGLTYLQGSEEVQAFVDSKRVERAERLAEQEKASLEGAIADGYVAAVETVGEKSIIVGKYINAEGNVIPPGRVQLVMKGVHSQFRDQLIGKAVGVTLDIGEGEKFELMEIYEVDEAKAQEVIKAKAAKAVEDAAKAAAEAATEEQAAEAPAEAPATSTEAQ